MVKYRSQTYRSSGRAFLALIHILLALGCSNQASDDLPSPTVAVIPVQVVTVRRQAGFSFPMTYYGRIRSARQSRLSFEIPGRLVEVLVDEGEQVSTGQPIARLDRSTLDAERRMLVTKRETARIELQKLLNGQRVEVIDSARAEVSRIDAELTRATLGSKRLRSLWRQGAAPREDYEQALYESKSLNSALDASKAKLREVMAGTRSEDLLIQRSRIAELNSEIDLLGIRLNKATLVAPFDAQVTRRAVDEGTAVQPGDLIFEMHERQRYEASFAIPVRQFTRKTLPDRISVAGQQIPVAGCRILKTVAAETQTVDVVIDLPTDARVVDGESCTISLERNVVGNCVALPMSALSPSIRGLWICYRLAKPQPDSRYVVIAEAVTISHTDGDSVFVETAMSNDELVVRSGVHKLTPGMVVRVIGDL